MKDTIIALLETLGFNMEAYKGADAKELKLSDEMVAKLQSIQDDNEKLAADLEDAKTTIAAKEEKITSLTSDLETAQNDLTAAKEEATELATAVNTCAESAGLEVEENATTIDTANSLNERIEEMNGKLAKQKGKDDVPVAEQEEGKSGNDDGYSDPYMEAQLKKHGIQ